MALPRSAFGAPLQGASDQRPDPSSGMRSPQGLRKSGLGPQGGAASGPAKPVPRRPLDRSSASAAQVRL